MDVFKRQTTDKLNEQIEKYIRDTALANDHNVTYATISSLYTGVRRLFLHILLLFKHFEARFKARIQYTSLNRSYSRLVLWHDAYHSKYDTLHSEIPQNFAESATRYLKGITRTLVDRFIYLVSNESGTKGIEDLDYYVQDVTSLIQELEADDNDGSDNSSNYGYDSYTEIAEDLKTDTTCLVGLNSLTNRPSLESQIIDEASGNVVKQCELYRPYCDRISNRFPNGAECLISRLGKANYDRYLRRIQRNNEDDDKTDEPDESDETERMQKAHTVVVSAFHDSGLGSSVPSNSSYAETVMSYSGDGVGQSVRVPPLSEEAKQGAPFTCVACFKTVSISNSSLWKRHLYEDLCPWMCLDPECSSGSRVFRRRNDWIDHLSLEHQLAPNWASFTCPLCRSEIEPGKISITRHLGNHLEEIALRSLPLQTEWDSENDDSTHASVSNESSRQQLPGQGDETKHPRRLEEDAKRDQYEQQFTLEEQPIAFKEPMSLDMGLEQPRISSPGNSLASVPQSEMPQPSNVSMIAEASDQESEPDDCCEICGYRPKGDPQWFKGSMAKHKKLQHSSEPPKIYRCTYPGCTASYENRPDNLRQHQIEKGHFVEGYGQNHNSRGNYKSNDDKGSRVHKAESLGDSQPLETIDRTPGGITQDWPQTIRCRKGPLSGAEREKALLVRRMGACTNCRMRRISCHPNHHNMTWEDAMSKYMDAEEVTSVETKPVPSRQENAVLGSDSEEFSSLDEDSEAETEHLGHSPPQDLYDNETSGAPQEVNDFTHSEVDIAMETHNLVSAEELREWQDGPSKPLHPFKASMDQDPKNHQSIAKRMQPDSPRISQRPDDQPVFMLPDSGVEAFASQGRSAPSTSSSPAPAPLVDPASITYHASSGAWSPYPTSPALSGATSPVPGIRNGSASPYVPGFQYSPYAVPPQHNRRPSR